MRRHTLVATVGTVAALTLVGYVVAATDDDDHRHRRPQTTFRANLLPGNEVPVCSATGRGSAKLTIDDDAQSIAFEVSYALEGTVTVSHVHIGQRFAAGGVSFFFCGGGGKPACPASPATITGTVVAADVLGPTNQGVAAGEFSEVLAAIREGNTYANVHSNICPAGEVRGQLR